MIKKYLKEIIILVLQLLMFYIFPLTAGPTDSIGLVVILLFSTFIFSIIIGSISKHSIKYFYPFIISLLFIPSVFIYYNESAFIHALWYMLDSLIGLLLGIIIFKIKNKKL